MFTTQLYQYLSVFFNLHYLVKSLKYSFLSTPKQHCWLITIMAHLQLSYFSVLKPILFLFSCPKTYFVPILFPPFCMSYSSGRVTCRAARRVRTR